MVFLELYNIIDLLRDRRNCELHGTFNVLNVYCVVWRCKASADHDCNVNPDIQNVHVQYSLNKLINT